MSSVERLKIARESAGYVAGVLGALVVLGVAMGGPLWLKIVGPAAASVGAVVVLLLYVAERRVRSRETLTLGGEHGSRTPDRTASPPADGPRSLAGEQPTTLAAAPDLGSETQAAHGHAHASDSTATPTGWPDVFISHAGEDKDLVARPLAAALKARGWSVWLDELELTVGDSLSGRIDDALAKSRFGVVVLSPAFFSKPWPQRELAGLAAREVSAGAKIILPVWHNVDQKYIVKRSPTLGDRLGSDTKRGIEMVADELARALTVAQYRAPLTGRSQPLLRAPFEVARGTRYRQRPRRTRWLVAGGPGAVIVGAIVGIQLAGGGPRIPALEQFASSTRVEMAYPHGYRRVAASEVFPELPLKQAIAVQDSANEPGSKRITVASGFTNATGAGLLPVSFRDIADSIEPESARIGAYEALVYRDVRLTAGLTRLYVIPTRNGVATTACTTPTRTAQSLCDAVVASQRFLEGEAVGLGVDKSYDHALDEAISELHRRRRSLRGVLADATTRTEQSDGAKNLAKAYRSTERTLGAAKPPPQIDDVHKALTMALSGSAAAHERLDLAGRAGNASAFNEARLDIATRESQVQSTLRKLERRGYGRYLLPRADPLPRLAERPPRAHPTPPTPPASPQPPPPPPPFRVLPDPIPE